MIGISSCFLICHQWLLYAVDVQSYMDNYSSVVTGIGDGDSSVVRAPDS